MKKYFVPSSVKLWNQLEDNVKDSPTLYVFKNKIKKQTIILTQEIDMYL